MIDDFSIQKHCWAESRRGRNDSTRNNSDLNRNRKKMINVSKINEKRIKINTDLLKLSIIIIRIVIIRNILRNLHHFLRLFHSKIYWIYLLLLSFSAVKLFSLKLWSFQNQTVWKYFHSSNFWRCRFQSFFFRSRRFLQSDI